MRSTSGWIRRTCFSVTPMASVLTAATRTSWESFRMPGSYAPVRPAVGGQGDEPLRPQG